MTATAADAPAGRRGSLPIGISLMGAVGPGNRMLPLGEQFKLIGEAGAFDYVERIPAPGETEAYRSLIARYDLPARCAGFYYHMHFDEPLLEWHLKTARFVGVRHFNILLRTSTVGGRTLTDGEVADFYVLAVELADRLGLTVSLEIHVNMWSEHFGRVARVGRMVEARGVPFRITLDHSHVIFKIDNPGEQQVQGMNREVESGELVLDPFAPGNVFDLWIGANWVAHMHARSTVPDNPKNTAARNPDGSVGRGIQYPFMEPADGEWHAPWHEEKLEPWKEVVRKVMRHHASDRASPLGQITTEFIPFPDYGEGAGYPIFANNVACAQWLRQTWQDIAG